MNTTHLKKFAQAARRQLREQVAAWLEQVLKTDSAVLREKESAVKELHKQIALTSREAVIDRVAYIWFNRFCALRFMDVNRYTRIGTVSPAVGFLQGVWVGGNGHDGPLQKVGSCVSPTSARRRRGL